MASAPKTLEAGTHDPNMVPTPADQQHPPPVSGDGQDEEVRPVSAAGEDSHWGEQLPANPVSRHHAMEDFAGLRRELTNLSQAHRTRSRTSAAHGADDKSIGVAEEGGGYGEDDDDDETEDGFDLSGFLDGGALERRTTSGEPGKQVGVVFKNLTVRGVLSSASTVRTLPDAVMGTFGPDLYNILCRFMPFLRFGRTPPTQDILHDLIGVAEDGQMMLVLGRPGSGCSTFLKAIANDRSSYVGVDGDVSYGGIPAAEQHKHYRGEVVYNPEDDQHFPNLTVWQTLRFSLMNKTRRRDKGVIPVVIDGLLAMFGIKHTANTVVGNAFVRGVSGGERKRVSIAETLATRAAVGCWDNSTRGLDASTALDYAKSLRIMTDVCRRTTLVTLYQAGEDIYQLMDTVLVLDEGRMLYQGPASEAKQYFIDLGFHCPPQSTTADFLTSLCDPHARRFQPGREGSTPKTAAELEAAFRSSPAYTRLLNAVTAYEQRLAATDLADAKRFSQSVGKSKSRTVPHRSPFTVSFPRQVWACVQREVWLLLGDRVTLATKFWIIVSISLIVSSLFYGEGLDTSGAFPRGGVLFFSILFLGWLQMTELIGAVSGRQIVRRHADYAFYRPSAVALARVITDFPSIFVMVSILSVVVYFMAGLDVNAGKFWIYYLFVYTCTFAITSLYRMFAALSPTIDDAVRFSGLALNLLIIFVGYVIPKPTLIHSSIWFGWLLYVNPIYYAYEGVLTNEFHDRVMECSPSMLVPQGPNVDPRYQSCTLTGATPGSHNVSGDSYVGDSFGFTRHHLWRNFGVLIAWCVLYILVTVIATEFLSFTGGGGGALVFKKSLLGSKFKKQDAKADEETGSQAANYDPAMAAKETGAPVTQSGNTSEKEDQPGTKLVASDRIFTWDSVDYEVPYGDGTRKLLNSVSGYAKPGVMIALMGASGAGKTTLLNTLAQRQSVGTVNGSMLVDGRPLGTDFQRGTGFCEQMDLHDGTATIREAFEFSALLRQDYSIPRAEKLEYVQRILDMLELDGIADALVGSLGVEQKKRVTIGVELAARPSLLLFLDEPTSGLDSQAALSVVRFLRKLTDAGQAIVCTIHQPSAMLIQTFDMILALNPGGNTFYFGPVGEEGSAVTEYFAARGAVRPPAKNVAEFILETAAKPGLGRDGRRIDWNAEWRESAERRALMDEIYHIVETRSHAVPTEGQNASKSAGNEFAAPTWLQSLLLTQRVFRQYWRDPSYYYSKIFVSCLIGIFNGFTFWMAARSGSVSSLQDLMFSCFLIILLPPIILNSSVPKFYTNMALWGAREFPSRIYSWTAFTTAQVVCEIPMAIVTATIYFLLWYYPVGFSYGSEPVGYTYLMTVLFFLFQASWGQWICAFAPSFTVIANVLPFFFVMTGLFNGIVRPWSSYPVFWKYWMYFLNPFTYILRGMLATLLPYVNPIECRSSEMTYVPRPPGQSCSSYIGQFVQETGRGRAMPGRNADECGYCQVANGSQYMAQLNVHAGDPWRCFGIFLAFVIVNYALVYFFVYTVRVRGWSFGLGYVFGILGLALEKVKSGIKKVLRLK